MSETTRGRAAAADDGLSPAELAARYGLVVSGARPGLVEYVRRLWARRHFIVAYARAKASAQYTQARLGQLWQVATPLLNAAVYYVIFGLLIGTDRGVDNYVAFLVTGVFVFTFTQSSVLGGVRAVSGNVGLVRALHFPRASLPIAVTLQQLQQLLVSMVVLLAVVVLTGEVPGWAWLLVVPVLVLQSVFNAGLALVMARLGSGLTDLAQLMPFVLRTWMYVSGVMYSIEHYAVGAPWWVRGVLEGNPAAVYIDLVRGALIGGFGVSGWVWGAAVGWAVLVGVGGFVYFWAAEERYGRG